MARPENLDGSTFGKLIVLKDTGERVGKGQRIMLCQCQCSSKSIIKARMDKLKSGHTKSCGCLKREVASVLGSNSKTHGACESRYIDGSSQLDYVIWSSIKTRCYNKKAINYKNYGKRGIKMFKEWKYKFESFSKYIRTLDNCPHEMLLTRARGKRLKVSIDRINVDKNYEPGNIKWSTAKEQANNRSNNKIVTIKGEFLTLAQAVDKYSIVSYSVVRDRVSKYGWDIEKALFTPSRVRKLKLIRFRRKK